MKEVHINYRFGLLEHYKEGLRVFALSLINTMILLNIGAFGSVLGFLSTDSGQKLFLEYSRNFHFVITFFGIGIASGVFLKMSICTYCYKNHENTWEHLRSVVEDGSRVDWRQNTNAPKISLSQILVIILAFTLLTVTVLGYTVTAATVL